MTKKDKKEIKHKITKEEIKENGLEEVLKPGDEIIIPTPDKPRVKPHWVDQTLWDSLTEAKRVKLCAGTPVGEL